jgi:site-specific DNA-cytosine methylase
MRTAAVLCFDILTKEYHPKKPMNKRPLSPLGPGHAMASLHPPPTAPTVKVFSDCSGIEAVVQAIRGLGLNCKVLAGCDNNPIVKRLWLANHTGTFYDDITTRDHAAAAAQLGRPDIYMCGFPCQPFSTAGQHLGFKDKRGTIIMDCISFIRQAAPKICILENVEGMVVSHKETLAWIIRTLREVRDKGYNVEAKLMNSTDNAIPHNRCRLFIVGILKASCIKPYKWPEPIGAMDIELILDPIEQPPTVHDHPAKRSNTALNNFLTLARKIVDDAGMHPHHLPTCIGDIDAPLEGRRDAMPDKNEVRCRRALALLQRPPREPERDPLLLRHEPA